MNAKPDPVMLPWLRSGQYVSNTPHARMLGMELVAAEPQRGTIKLPWRADLSGESGDEIIAGGAVTALLDHTCGLAVLASMDKPGFCATLDLRIDYQRPAGRQKPVTAEAWCYKLTRQIAFVRATAWDETPEHPVAAAQATFVLTSISPTRR